MKSKAIQILKWSEKYTKTDMIYFARGSFWLIIGKIFSVLISIAVAVAFANLLSKTEYGIYRYLLSIGGIFWALTVTGLGSTLIHAISRGSDGELMRSFKTQLKWSAVISFIIFGVAGYYFFKGNLIFGSAILILGLFTPLLKSFELYPSVLIGKKLFRTQTIVSILQNTLASLLIIGALFITNNAAVLITIYLLGHTATHATLFFFIKYKYIQNSTIEPNNQKFAIKLSGTTATISLAREIDKILLFQLLGPATLALYSFALSPVEQLKGLGKTFLSLIAPKLSSQTLKNLRSGIVRQAFFFFSLAGMLVFGYFLIAEVLFTILFPQYLEAVAMSKVLSLSLFFILTAIPLREMCVVLKNNQSLYVADTIPPILRIVSLPILIPLFGAWGIVFALLSTQMIRFFAFVFFVIKSK